MSNSLLLQTVNSNYIDKSKYTTDCLNSPDVNSLKCEVFCQKEDLLHYCGDWTRLSAFGKLDRWDIFVPSVCTFFHIHSSLQLPSSHVFLSYFNVTVPMRRCPREHSCKFQVFYCRTELNLFFLDKQPYNKRLHGITPKPQ